MHTIECPVNWTLVENHDVLSQGPRFVREHIFDLAELLIKGGGTRLCWCVLRFIKHLLIPVDIETVAQSYYLNTKEKARKEWSWVKAGQVNSSPWFPSFQFCGGNKNQNTFSQNLQPWRSLHTSQPIVILPWQLSLKALLDCRIYWLTLLRHSPFILLLPKFLKFCNNARPDRVKLVYKRQPKLS